MKKHIKASFIHLDLDDITGIELENDRVWIYQSATDGGREVAMSLQLNPVGERLELDDRRVWATDVEFDKPVKDHQFAVKTLAAARRRLRRWASAKALANATGLSTGSIPAVLTDLRRSGLTIERRQTPVFGRSRWRIAANV